MNAHSLSPAPRKLTADMASDDHHMPGYNAKVDNFREEEYPMLKGERLLALTEVLWLY